LAAGSKRRWREGAGTALGSRRCLRFGQIVRDPSPRELGLAARKIAA